jgi:tetratricopeptide (TPR) repeat protein
MFSRIALYRMASLVVVLAVSALLATGCEDPSLKFNRAGMEAYQAGDLTRARAGFEEAIATNPDIGEYYYSLAICEQALHNWDAAIAKYDMAINLSPRIWRSFENKAQCYMEKGDLGDLAKAEETLITGTKDCPFTGEMFIATARFYARRNDTYTAKLWLAKGVAADPQNPVTHREYGMYLAAAGEKDKAVVELRKSLDLNPVQPDVSAKLSELAPRGSELPPPKPMIK